MIHDIIIEHRRIMNIITELCRLKSYEFIDDIEYDEDKQIFYVTIAEETQNGTEYIECKITLQLVENYYKA
ncbi:hypothetical protein [Vibrio phage XZ1]|uniref:Uncharacterized protein n=1 Tax=Vibrio phage ValKK3 TaxID=1610855 RepID=A0A0D4DAL7_9CAUD|nr:hypothetical protein AVU32_gp094 [Vibrio phage ValKK3]AJT60935.1 hypothetical protein [Vibrio phage ValKK3]UOL51361.1 hypothetical protein [Vibrio phage XZ1]